MKTNNILVSVKNTKLEIFNDIPLGIHSRKMNNYYLKMCLLLEEGTNRLVLKNNDDKLKNVLVNKRMLMSYFNVITETGTHILNIMRKKNIIMTIILGRTQTYLMNPEFAFRGDYIPQYLIDLFRTNVDNTYSKENITIKGMHYEER